MIMRGYGLVKDTPIKTVRGPCPCEKLYRNPVLINPQTSQSFHARIIRTTCLGCVRIWLESGFILSCAPETEIHTPCTTLQARDIQYRHKIQTVDGLCPAVKVVHYNVLMAIITVVAENQTVAAGPIFTQTAKTEYRYDD